MKKWRKKKEEDDDDILSFDDFDDEGEEEEEDEKPRRRRYSPPRPIRTHYSYDDPDDEDEESGPTFDELEPKIRAGKYKPKPNDPWNAHVLYQMLKKQGRI